MHATGWLHRYQDALCRTNPWNYSVDPEVRRDGPADFPAERFHLKHGDLEKLQNPVRERAEKTQWLDFQQDGDRGWYGWSFFVDRTFSDTPLAPNASTGNSGDVTMSQFHQEAGDRASHDPLVMFGKQGRGGPFQMRILPTFHFRAGRRPPARTLIEDASFRGRWHDLVVEAKWSSARGFVRVWVDDAEEPVEFEGQTCQASGGIYHKYGLYRFSDAANPDMSVWFSHLRRGDRREHVDRRS